MVKIMSLSSIKQNDLKTCEVSGGKAPRILNHDLRLTWITTLTPLRFILSDWSFSTLEVGVWMDPTEGRVSKLTTEQRRLVSHLTPRVSILQVHFACWLVILMSINLKRSAFNCSVNIVNVQPILTGYNPGNVCIQQGLPNSYGPLITYDVDFIWRATRILNKIFFKEFSIN